MSLFLAFLAGALFSGILTVICLAVEVLKIAMKD